MTLFRHSSGTCINLIKVFRAINKEPQKNALQLNKFWGGDSGLLKSVLPWEQIRPLSKYSRPILITAALGTGKKTAVLENGGKGSHIQP